jgi:hypothetical protein
MPGTPDESELIYTDGCPFYEVLMYLDAGAQRGEWERNAEAAAQDLLDRFNHMEDIRMYDEMGGQGNYQVSFLRRARARDVAQTAIMHAGRRSTGAIVVEFVGVQSGSAQSSPPIDPSRILDITRIVVEMPDGDAGTHIESAVNRVQAAISSRTAPRSMSGPLPAGADKRLTTFDESVYPDRYEPVHDIMHVAKSPMLRRISFSFSAKGVFELAMIVAADRPPTTGRTAIPPGFLRIMAEASEALHLAMDSFVRRLSADNPAQFGAVPVELATAARLPTAMLALLDFNSEQLHLPATREVLDAYFAEGYPISTRTANPLRAALSWIAIIRKIVIAFELRRIGQALLLSRRPGCGLIATRMVSLVDSAVTLFDTFPENFKKIPSRGDMH